MSIKQVAVAAAAVLLLTGTLATTAGAQQTEVEQRCRGNETVATGAATILGKWRARQLGITAWQREVRAKYGERYMDFAKARGVSFECQSASPGAILSKLSKRCIVRATPCRYATVENDNDEDFGQSEDDRRVFRIQRLLARAGYLDSDQIDGVYGQTTRSAVRRFQVDADLRATGEMDDRTYRRLRRRAESKS